MNGIINLNKPEGMTSHDAVNIIRKIINTKRVGHSGTLDPNVTGVLPICIGRATRVAEYLLEADKEYIGEMTLGIATDSQDKDGQIIEKSSKTVLEEDILNSFEKFKGRIEQIPPMHSALKHKGKKLYELAREGKTVERKPREVYIHQLDILENHNNQIIKFYVRCSKGTYVRTLCNDIGEDLGTKAYMSNLVRIGVADFKLEESITIDQLKNMGKDEIKNTLYPIDYAVKDFEELIIEDRHFKKLVNGVMVEIKNDLEIGFLYRIYCRETFIGLGEIINKEQRQYLKMKKVLTQGEEDGNYKDK